MKKDRSQYNRIKQSGLFRFAVPLVFWLAVWIIAAAYINVPLILPGPAEVLRHLINLIVTADFWIRTAVTLVRIVCGFICGTAAAIILAVLSSVSELCRCIILPVVRIVRATPVVSFIILVMLWVSYGAVPALTSSLMVCPLVYTNIMAGIEQTDSKLLEMAKIFRLPKTKIIKSIYIPSLMPYFSAACVNATGLAWKSGIAAEVLCLPENAIGSSIYHSKIYLETADLFAWTAVVVILSILIEKLIARCMKRKQK